MLFVGDRVKVFLRVYNILDWKEMQEGSGEVNIRKAGICTSDINFR